MGANKKILVRSSWKYCVFIFAWSNLKLFLDYICTIFYIWLFIDLSKSFWNHHKMSEKILIICYNWSSKQLQDLIIKRTHASLVLYDQLDFICFMPSNIQISFFGLTVIAFQDFLKNSQVTHLGPNRFFGWQYRPN